MKQKRFHQMSGPTGPISATAMTVAAVECTRRLWRLQIARARTLSEASGVAPDQVEALLEQIERTIVDEYPLENVTTMDLQLAGLQDQFEQRLKAALKDPACSIAASALIVDALGCLRQMMALLAPVVAIAFADQRAH